MSKLYYRTGKLSLILGLLSLLGTANAADVDINYEKFVLDNGLTLIVHEDNKAPVVAVNVWYHVGSKNEVPGRTGFAHLFEHLMFQGSENFNDEYLLFLQQLGHVAEIDSLAVVFLVLARVEQQHPGNRHRFVEQVDPGSGVGGVVLRQHADEPGDFQHADARELQQVPHRLPKYPVTLDGVPSRLQPRIPPIGFFVGDRKLIRSGLPWPPTCDLRLSLSGAICVSLQMSCLSLLVAVLLRVELMS